MGEEGSHLRQPRETELGFYNNLPTRTNQRPTRNFSVLLGKALPYGPEGPLLETAPFLHVCTCGLGAYVFARMWVNVWLLCMCVQPRSRRWVSSLTDLYLTYQGKVSHMNTNSLGSWSSPGKPPPPSASRVLGLSTQYLCGCLGFGLWSSGLLESPCPIEPSL